MTQTLSQRTDVDVDELGLDHDEYPSVAAADARTQGFLCAFGSGLVERDLGVGALHTKDIQVLLFAARNTAALELQVAELRLAAGRRERTGALLSGARAELDIYRETFAEIGALAAQHLRGDPHGPQGAAAQLILDALARSARDLGKG